MDFLAYFLVGGILSAVFIKLAIKFFPKIGLLDFPERYQLVRQKLPYPGGLIISILSLGLIFIDDNFLILMPFIAVLTILSFFDDRRNLSIFFRAISHISIAIIIFLIGIKIDFIGDPFSQTNIQLAPIISLFITVSWIILLQHATNWFDGIKGLCVGISGLGFLFLGILGLVKPELFFNPNETSLTFANFFLSGLCFGGWWWFWQGKIILGDTGSQVLGFLLAIMSIFTGAKIGTTFLILSLPLLDFLAVTIRRIFIEKVSPFRGDSKHFPQILAKKFTEKKSVLFLIFISIILGIIGLSFSYFYKFISIVIISIIILFFIIKYQKNS